MAASGSGNPKVKFNTRERMLSSDQNRVQAMGGQHLANAMRFLLDASTEEDDQAGAVETLSDGTEASLQGVVFSGLRAQPIDGTVDMLVTPGSCLLADRVTPGVDDSIAAIVTDPGVQTTGVLTLTAGAGSIRIDVLECQRVTLVTETQNRDIFNPATGLFAPSQVDKVTMGRLVFRLRTGTAGAGFPGVASGWMPIAVCSVAAGATSWDNVKIWDVRPLASDRWNAPFNSVRTLPERGRCFIYSDVTTAVGEIRVAGIVEAQFGAYRAGGHLGMTSNSGATGYIDVRLASNRAGNHPGYTADQYWHLYAIFPFGLPRWVRYTDSGSGGRKPRGMRGIPAVTATKPEFSGRPSSAISTPTALGLLVTTNDAICLLAGRVTNAGTPLASGIACDGRITTMVNGADVSNTPGAVVAGISAQWTLDDGVAWPAGARAIWVRISMVCSVGSAKTFAVEGDLLVTGPDGLSTSHSRTVELPQHTYATNGSLVLTYSAMARIPLVCDPFDPTNGASAPRAFRILWTHNVDQSGLIGVTDSAHNMNVVGWEMGP